jgi:hypothetical protein
MKTNIKLGGFTMKNIAIKVFGIEREPYDVVINPGTTPVDVVRDLNLNGYKLTKDRDKEPFGDDENIYPLVEDGAKLFATTHCELG